MEILNSIRNIISQIGFLPIFIISALFSLYIYWRESKKMGKNQNSIFDGFFLSSIFTIIWGRLTFILANPINYEGLVWSVVPYERYPDGFYLFRLLPWRYLRLWDGEFLFTGLFIGFIVSSFIYAMLAKKWRWREMAAPVITSASFSFGMLLSIFGFVMEDNRVLLQGVVVLGAIFLYFSISWLLKKIQYAKDSGRWEKFNHVLIGAFIIFVTVYFPVTLLSSDITTWDRWNIYIFLVFSAISLPLYIIDVLRTDIIIQTKYKTRSVSISTNQPVKV